MAAHTEHDLEALEESMGSYNFVFISLLVLLALTYAAYLKDLSPYAPSGINLNLVVALIIAVIKASMVLMVFMHVRLSPKIVWVFSISAFFWLAIMIAGFENDYVTRGMDSAYSHQILSPEAAAMVHAQ
jgi:cytochrome c oxidase subunit 4